MILFTVEVCKTRKKLMEEKSSSNFETIEAILIAVTTVLGAIVAWRASVADDASGVILQPAFLLLMGSAMLIASLYLHGKTARGLCSRSA
jgi:hypothetical protein